MSFCGQTGQLMENVSKSSGILLQNIHFVSHEAEIELAQNLEVDLLFVWSIGLPLYFAKINVAHNHKTARINVLFWFDVLYFLFIYQF